MGKKWVWRDLKESVGFKTFKNDYIRIFNTFHSQLLGDVSGYRQPRIYKTIKHDEESILNYINTNVSAYTIIVNETLNKVDFNPMTEDGYQTMMNYILSNKWFWMEILPKINDVILFTSSRGKKTEDLVNTKLIEHFKGKFEVSVIGGLGEVDDMKRGVDMIIKNKSGKSFNVQVKKCKSIKLINENEYDITYVGVNKTYDKIDYMVFVFGENIYVFDNKKIKTKYGGYECNKEDLKIIL